MTQGPNRMGKQPSGQTDIIPGIAAAVSLALLVLILHMNPYLAIVLAGLIYAGVWLATRRTPIAPVRETEAQKAVALDQLGRTLANRDIGRRVCDIAARANAILTYLASNPDQDARWRDYIRECLDATLENTQKFAALASRLRDASHPAIRNFADYTASMLQTLDDINTKMVDEDAATFSAQVDSYQSTLQELNQIYLGKGNTE